MKLVWTKICQNNSGGYYLENMPGQLWVQHLEGASVLAYVDSLNVLEEKMVGAPYCHCCGPRWEDDINHYDAIKRDKTYDWATPVWILHHDGTLEKDVPLNSLPI